MKQTSDFFSASRYFKLSCVMLKSEGVTLLGVVSMGIVLVCLDCFTNGFSPDELQFYAEHSHQLQPVSGGRDFMFDNYAHISHVILCFSCIYGASRSWPFRMDKKNLQWYFLLPASRFEKYLGGLIFIVCSALLACVTILALDFLRLAYISAVYPTLKDYVSPFVCGLDFFSLPSKSYLALAVTLFLISGMRLTFSCRKFWATLLIAGATLFVLYRYYHIISFGSDVFKLCLAAPFIACSVFFEWMVYRSFGKIECK